MKLRGSGFEVIFVNDVPPGTGESAWSSYTLVTYDGKILGRLSGVGLKVLKSGSMEMTISSVLPPGSVHNISQADLEKLQDTNRGQLT